MTSQVTNTNNYSVKQFVKMDSTKKRFEDVLGQRAPQFLSSLVSIVNSNPKLKEANAATVVNSALIAATLDLPVNPSLGYMYIVPFNHQAQPQIGYKGYIQLAQRSGQYKKITVAELYKDEFISWDPLAEELKYEAHREKDRSNNEKPVGYFGHFELLNGFQKTVYWTYQQIDNHRKKFSKSGGKEEPKGVWAKNYDAMALKTVIKDLLTKWGPMTVDMQTAYSADEQVPEEPRDVTPTNEEVSSARALINSYGESEQKKDVETAKEEKKDGTNESQEELFPSEADTVDAK